MGMELIGYLVKGPAELDKRKCKKAVDTAMRLVEAAQQYLKHKTAKVPKVLAHLDDYDIERLARHTRESVSKLITRFYEFWAEREERDTYWRLDPDDKRQVIMFAGEGTWGDEPSGVGYEALRDSAVLGIWPILGIR